MLYLIRHSYLAKASEVFFSMYAAKGKTQIWFVSILAMLLLICAGITYRVLASHLKLVVDAPIRLPVSLNAFPTEIDSWVGKDAPISEKIQRVAGNDDFLNRLYINKSNNEWANIYIAYTARPRNMLGHRPQICYPSGGWVHDNTEPSEVISRAGRKIPCLVHYFHMPAPRCDQTVVLNYYIVNGQLSSDQSTFSGLGWRTPNIAGNPARYVAQIQISSVQENPILSAARDFTDLIMEFFPDRNGRVKAAEYANTQSGVLK